MNWIIKCWIFFFNFTFKRFAALYRYLMKNIGFIYWRHINLPSKIANQLCVSVTIFFTLIIYNVFVYFIYLQFFDHPVITDFLTDRWYGVYENRKLSRLWWFLLTIWCLFDIVLFPLMFLLTRVIGKVIYFHEFDDISLNVDSQVFNINDCGPWIFKLSLFSRCTCPCPCCCFVCSHFIFFFAFVFVFSLRNLSQQLNIIS